MRHLLWCAAASLTLAALGCGGSGASSPVAPDSDSTLLATPQAGVSSVDATLGTVARQGDLETAALGIYTVTIDPDTLSATSALKETRTGQANDDLYLLSIDSFLNAGSFKIASIAADASSIYLGYTVTHPFPAPSDPLGTPNGSTNRADLGIAGMVLFLADVTSATGNTYFTDRIANTELVANPAAYYSPGGLLTLSGTANTFPYRKLVNETMNGTGSRDDITNGGDVHGNFGTDGWTRAEFGVTNNGWTGYGVLHQGQASSNEVALDRASLSGGFSLDVAIIAKYNDPRGGATAAQKKANRLPPATADASLFAYRMPHGALDCAAIVVESEAAGFVANTISAAQMSIHVEDWDARATETTEADLADDASFTNVAIGESGVPTVEICIPNVLGDATTTASVSTVVDDDSTYGGDAGQDSGEPGDLLFYSELVTKTAGAGQTAGDFTGMVRVTDVETGLTVGLDGNLLPLATAPEPVTYQSFTITQLPDNATPTAVVTLTSSDPLLSGTMPGVSVTSIVDADGDNLDVLVDWGDGLGFQTIATGLTGPAYPDQTPSGPQMNNADLTIDTINLTVRVTDGTSNADFPISYDLGPNRAPVVTGTPALATSAVFSPATFTMNAGTATATDPEGDAVSYTIVNNANSDQETFGGFPNTANSTPIVPFGSVDFTTYANDALHPTTSGTAYPVVVGNVIPSGPAGWNFVGVTQGSGTQSAYDIAVDQTSGDVYFVGSFGSAVDFGDGPTAAAGDYLVKLNEYGIFQWKREILATTSASNTGKAENVSNVVVRPSGNVVIVGTFDGDLNFGGPTHSSDISSSVTNDDLYMAEFTSANAYVQSAILSGPGNILLSLSPPGQAVSLDSDGDLAIAATYDQNFTMGTVTITNPQGATDTTDKPLVLKVNSAFVAQWGYTPVSAADTGTEAFNTCAFDPAGNVWAGGDGESNIDFGGGVISAPNDPNDSGGSIVKINGATGGYGGYQRIVQGTTGSCFDDTWSIATDANRVYITGQFHNGADFGGGGITLTGTGSGHVVAALNFSGVQQWVWDVDGDAQFDELYGLASDGTFVYAVGETYTGVDFGFGPVTTGATGVDPIAVKLNATTGAIVWADAFLCDTSDADIFETVALDAAGDIYVTGNFEDINVDWDPGAGNTNTAPSGLNDNFVVNHWLTGSNSY